MVSICVELYFFFSFKISLTNVELKLFIEIRLRSMLYREYFRMYLCVVRAIDQFWNPSKILFDKQIKSKDQFYINIVNQLSIVNLFLLSIWLFVCLFSFLLRTLPMDEINFVKFFEDFGFNFHIVEKYPTYNVVWQNEQIAGNRSMW